MNIDETRFFQGHETRQVGVDGEPAIPDHWYYEPVDYEGDVIWSDGWATREEAEAAASAEVEEEKEGIA